MGKTQEDLLEVRIANVSCTRLNYTSPSILRCDSPIISDPSTGGIAVTTKSGGRGYADLPFAFIPQCHIYRNAGTCIQKGCSWCNATTVCVDDMDSCPAQCLLNSDSKSCLRSSGCTWCHATTTCLDRQADCPPACFLFNTESACSSIVGKEDGCEWCHSTATCLYTGTSAISSFSSMASSSDILFAKGHCPNSCSFGSPHFTCGSLILLTLIVMMLATLIGGFYSIVYFVQRDENFANRLRRYGRRRIATQDPQVHLSDNYDDQSSRRISYESDDHDALRHVDKLRDQQPLLDKNSSTGTVFDMFRAHQRR